MTYPAADVVAPAEPLDVGPETAARLGILPAAPGIRSVAFVIDASIWLALLVPAVVGGLLLIVADDPLLPIVLIAVGVALPLLFGLIQLIVHGSRGVTVGKAAMRLRSVRVDDLARPGFWWVALRALVLWCSAVVPLVGPALMFASGLWDRQRRGRSILDRVGRCWVIDARAGLDPFDAKALRSARRELRGRPDQSEALPSMATGADAEAALRIPHERSRAGVVGPGSTGAQWSAAAPFDDSVIAEVPGGASRGVADESTGFARAEHRESVATPRVDAPAAPAPATRRAAQAPTRRDQGATVRFDDGSALRVPTAGLIGRDPEPAAGEQVDALVRLEDPQLLLSKTHAAFGIDADGLWVSDRGSRNGTQLVSPGGDVVPVAAGERTPVPLGWAVHVGGRSFELMVRGADS